MTEHETRPIGKVLCQGFCIGKSELDGNVIRSNGRTRMTLGKEPMSKRAIVDGTHKLGYDKGILL